MSVGARPPRRRRRGAARHRARRSTLVGLAGTVTTVAAVEQGLPEYDRERIHHFRLTPAAAEDVFRTLALEPADVRRHNPGLEPGRVDVIVGGAIVLVSILRAFGFDEVLVSEADILDGLVRSLAADRIVSRALAREIAVPVDASDSRSRNPSSPALPRRE